MRAPGPRPQPALAALGLVAALAAACSVAPLGKGRPEGRPLASPAALPSGLRASPEAPATGAKPPAGQGDAPASPAVRLRLPGRLGLALPASLVGSQAQASLKGLDGAVAPESSLLLALNDGRILSNHGAGLISDQGGGLISDQGGGLVANNGGGIVSNNSGAYRLGPTRALAQADLQASGETITLKGVDPRRGLWLLLALLDADDQMLQAYLDAEPKVNEWRRFQVPKLRVLPPPVPDELFLRALDTVLKGTREGAFAGHFGSEGPEAGRLRLVFLPQPESPLNEGIPILDLQASGADTAVGRTRFLPAIGEVLGLKDSAARVVVGRNALGPTTEVSVAELMLPEAERSPLAQGITAMEQVASRRYASLSRQAPDRARAVISSSQLEQSRRGEISFSKHLQLLGYHPTESESLGLAFLGRVAQGPLDSSPSFDWSNPSRPGSEPAQILFFLPNGNFSFQGPPALARLAPSYGPSDDAFIPPTPQMGEDPSQDPQLRPSDLSAALLALPLP